LQGAGEEREQEWEFHGSTSALFFLTPALSQTVMVVRFSTPSGIWLWLSLINIYHPTTQNQQNRFWGFCF
ncbi:hypothetical protein, partial [Enterobacter mori]